MMMKLGRRKSSSCSSASKHSSSISHVFPISWLSKLKQKGGDSERKPAKEKGKEERNSSSKRFPWPESWRDGRFCEGDDDLFWRLSFGEERFEGETSRVGLKSGLYDSDNELELPVFGTQNCEPKETMKFNEMVFNIRKLRDLEENGRELERKTYKADGKFMVAEKKEKFELEPRKRIQTTERNCHRIEENCECEALNLEKTCGYVEEHIKIKELLSKNEKQRKSVYISKELQKRRKQSGKARVSLSSPRTAIKIECKIRALEDKKREKFKKKKEKEGREVQETSAFDQFAVVKCSYSPEQDFRDSMVEMIREKGIRRPEELEELLACYLTLNSDEYHDLIIKVFRQVWFDMEGTTRNFLI